MLLLNPKNYQDRHYPDERSKEIMVKTIDWFESKGMKKMKEDYRSREFTYDFAEFIKKEKIFETLFLPKGYGEKDQYYSTYRMYEFSEICWFYGTAYWYTYHVSTLGLDPVFLGDNEEAKQKAKELTADPMLLSWYSGETGDYYPKTECGRADKPAWIVFAESRGADIAININDGEYIFLYLAL